MLEITIPAAVDWDEANEMFVQRTKEQTLRLEHSLVSLYKWESKWHKSFLSSKEKTDEEILDYIKCMTLTQGVNPEVYNHLTSDNVKEIKAYIEDPMTATTFYNAEQHRPNREVITAELIYYWMIMHQIPFECRKWHLNQLLTLVQVCNIKNAPPKKRSKKSIANQQAALNAARRKQFNTRG